ncbi:MAG: hypothetical protein Q8L14_18060 [Myxococcales bacterium]|nr:hypothetical protein [Myxococcales bacterium]
MMRSVVVVVGALGLACAAKVRADFLEPVSGREFAADQSFCLLVRFGFNTSEATCAVSVDGGVVSLETSATFFSSGCQPGGLRPEATCQVPPLAPGSYRLVPFNQMLTVVVDGGVTGCRYYP